MKEKHKLLDGLDIVIDKI